MLSRSARVLVVLMSDFARGPSSHRGHKNSIVIDETQLSVFDDDVAVLQIAVRNTRRSAKHPAVVTTLPRDAAARRDGSAFH